MHTAPWTEHTGMTIFNVYSEISLTQKLNAHIAYDKIHRRRHGAIVGVWMKQWFMKITAVSLIRAPLECCYCAAQTQLQVKSNSHRRFIEFPCGMKIYFITCLVYSSRVVSHNMRTQSNRCRNVNTLILDCEYEFLFLVKHNPLGQWKFRRVVQCNRRSFAILFPWIRTRLTSTTCVLLTAKRSSNFYWKWFKSKKNDASIFICSF